MNLDLQAYAPYLGVIEIILAVMIVILVVLQSKGSDLSSFLGGDSSSSSFRTKRGLEVVLHRWTIGTSIAFFVCTLFTFIAMGQAS